MSEYQKTFDLMMEQNKELFDNFADIHREYDLHPEQWQKFFGDLCGKHFPK